MYAYGVWCLLRTLVCARLFMCTSTDMYMYTLNKYYWTNSLQSWLTKYTIMMRGFPLMYCNVFVAIRITCTNLLLCTCTVPVMYALFLFREHSDTRDPAEWAVWGGEWRRSPAPSPAPLNCPGYAPSGTNSSCVHRRGGARGGVWTLCHGDTGAKRWEQQQNLHPWAFAWASRYSCSALLCLSYDWAYNVHTL